MAFEKELWKIQRQYLNDSEEAIRIAVEANSKWHMDCDARRCAIG